MFSPTLENFCVRASADTVFRIRVSKKSFIEAPVAQVDRASAFK